ncbi:MAG: hypothetical protein LC637_11505 [Xanthomonadaceae bacterium]|nr:hypothetical protein [Xanthomonadaceae bacterium]
MKFWLVALLLSLCVAGSALAQSDGAAFDTAIGLPQPMVVDRVDHQAGLVVLNGRSYRVSASKASIAALQTSGRWLTLNDLRPGMEVLVSTDATQPTAKHTPDILGMWRIE